MQKISTFVAMNIARIIEHFFFQLGQWCQWMWMLASRPEKWSVYYREAVRQADAIGIGSLPVVFIISVFFGAVTAVQFSYQISGTFVPNYYIGYIVRDMSIIELAPTFTCMLLAGKVGANIATEIGGMRQKEIIDAMEVMGVNTVAFLVWPRLVAALLVIPMLVVISAGVSIVGGFYTSIWGNLFTASEYILGLHSFFEPYNVFIMLVKAVVFAFLLTTISAYQGYFVGTGSIELGRASTRAVVFSDVAILIADYVIAVIMT